MTDAERILELERLLKVALYDRECLQKRLDNLRSVKDQLIRLIETPTLSERLDALAPNASDADVMGAIMNRKPSNG